MKEVIKMSNEEYLKLLKEHDELVAEHCPKCGGDDFNTIALLDYESEILMVECTNCLWAGTTEELVKGKVIKMKEDYAKALKEFNEIKNAEENEMAKAKAVVVDKVRFLGELYGQRKAQALKQLRLVEDVIKDPIIRHIKEVAYQMKLWEGNIDVVIDSSGDVHSVQIDFMSIDRRELNKLAKKLSEYFQWNETDYEIESGSDDANFSITFHKLTGDASA